MTDPAEAFLRTHSLGVLATSRRDGSPQQSMVGYLVDERAELSALVFGRLTDSDPPDPITILGMLDEQHRTILRITPTNATLHE